MPYQTKQVSRLLRLTCITTAAVLLSLSSVAVGEARSWDLLACAEPDNLPYSNREQAGFENEIAALLANELGAELEYAWLPLPRREGNEELMLRMGACDLLLGVPDGTEPYLTTLAYYRSTAVFVLPEDAPFEIESLDDPILQELTIGVQRGSPEDFALIEQGMIDNVRHFFASDPGEAILTEVSQGTLDVGIVWGPIAGYQQGRLGLPVRLQPVTPQFSGSFLPMVQSTAMAVRGNDRALQESLNRAMAARWNEIQAILRDYGVPLVDLPQPQLEAQSREAPLGIGLVLPSLTGIDPLQPLGPELTAQPALQGAILAEEQLGGGPTGQFRILQATAPSPEAAARAARRLLAVNRATALIGGIGEGHAEALARIAQESAVLFINIGASDDSLRCKPLTLHIEASDSMYVDAVIRLMNLEGLESPYLVRTADMRSERLQRLLQSGLPNGASIAGSEVVAANQALFLPTFERIAESGADSILLLLEASGQLVFLGQYDMADAEAVPIGFPWSSTQTRQFYAALAQDAPRTGTGTRVALWDAALESEAASNLNESYLARWGRPMDPAAWAAHAAVKALARAFEAARASSPGALEQQLRTAQAIPLELGKQGEQWFSAEGGQLRQQLFVVDLDPEATSRRAIAEPVAALGPENGEDAGYCFP